MHNLRVVSTYLLEHKQSTQDAQVDKWKKPNVLPMTPACSGQMELGRRTILKPKYFAKLNFKKSDTCRFARGELR